MTAQRRSDALLHLSKGQDQVLRIFHALRRPKNHSQARPPRRPGGNLDMATVQSHDFLNQIEPKARAAPCVTETVKGLEDLFVFFRRDTVALVAHVDPSGTSDTDRDHSTSAAMIDRILHEIGQRSFERRFVPQSHDAVGFWLERHVIPRSKGEWRKVQNDLLGHDRQVHWIARSVPLIEALKIEELPRQHCEA